MTDHLTPPADGHTDLTPDELADLVPTWVRTRGDLNVAEAQAIAQVQLRYARRTPPLDTILDDLWLRHLHCEMFGAVWRWAGRYRATERNTGIEPVRISVAVSGLVADAVYWFHGDDPTEAAARFHHRLVEIHPFPNGNGRHARLMTDLCVRRLRGHALTWGATRGTTPEQTRHDYIAALQAADRGVLAPLQAFIVT